MSVDHFSRPSPFGTADTGMGQISMGGCPGHWVLLHSSPGPPNSMPRALQTSVMTITNVPQTSLSMLWGQDQPQLRTRGLRGRLGESSGRRGYLSCSKVMDEIQQGPSNKIKLNTRAQLSPVF